MGKFHNGYLMFNITTRLAYTELRITAAKHVKTIPINCVV